MTSQSIKGISIKIGADTTALTTALKNTESTSRKLKSELREVEKALKLDPKNTVLLQQKQELLAKSVASAKEKVNLLHDAQAQVEEQFKNGKISGEQYRAFQREVSSAESELRNLSSEIHESEKSSKKLSEVVGVCGTAIKKATEIVKKFAHAASELAKVALKSLQTSLKAVSKEIEVGMKAFKAYVTGLTTATTAIGAFAVKSGQDFEKSMSNVKALSGATGEEFQQLSDKAKEMGANTSKSAAESADALGYMALAGWDTSQMLTGLEPILRASEAGNMDLATCSDLVTDSMSAMGIKVQDLDHYLDVCTKTQSSSNTSLNGLLEAYVGCGGTLKNLNVSVEESATVLGTLANRGIKGAEAGTALNSIMVNLVGANKNAASAMSELGVSAWDENGNFIGLSETLKRLNGALENCTDEQKSLFEAQIGGKTQMDTLQAMLSGVSEEYDDLNTKINNCDGCLINTAKTMQDNFSGAVTELKSATEGLGISIFDTFSSKLTDSVRNITGFVSHISNAIQNGNIIGAIRVVQGDIVKAIKSGIGHIRRTISHSTSIFNEVIVAIAETINDLLPILFDDVLPRLMRGMFNLINRLIEKLPTFVKTVSAGAAKMFTGLMSGMKEAVSKLLAVLPELVETITTVIRENFPAIFQTGISIITELISGIVKNLPMIIETAQELILSMVETLVSNLPSILDSGVKILLELIRGITDMLPEIIDAAVDIIFIIVDTIINNLDEIIDVAVEIILTICEAILNNIDRIMETVPEIITAIVKAITENLDKIIEAAIVILVTIGTTLIESASELITFIPELCDKIGKAFKEINWGEIGENIMNSIFDGITRIGDKASELLAGAGENILDVLGFHPDGTYTLPFFADGGTLTSGSAIVGEAGPELLSVANGRAVVTPLTGGNSGAMSASLSPSYSISNVVYATVKSDYDVSRIAEQLAFEQKRQINGMGG